MLMVVTMVVLLVVLAFFCAVLLMDREARRAEVQHRRTDNARISLGAYRYTRRLTPAVAGFPAGAVAALCSAA